MPNGKRSVAAVEITPDMFGGYHLRVNRDRIYIPVDLLPFFHDEVKFWGGGATPGAPDEAGNVAAGAALGLEEQEA